MPYRRALLALSRAPPAARRPPPPQQEILIWFNGNAAALWGDEAPTLQEARVHAKCLRSLPTVRDYFRNYRRKKRTARCARGCVGEPGGVPGRARP